MMSSSSSVEAASNHMSVDSGPSTFQMKPQIKRMCTNKEGEYRSRQ